MKPEDVVNEFPVCMGMNRSARDFDHILLGVPRVYGDEPALKDDFFFLLVSSPCVWG